MIKNYIFDFDGTIADTLQLTLNLFNELSAIYSYPKLDQATIDTLKNDGAKAFLLRLGIDATMLPKVLAEIKEREASVMEQVNVFKDIPDTLLRLRQAGKKLGILTNNTVENVHAFLSKHDMDFFDFVISSGGSFSKKSALESTLKEYALRPDETVYIGDEDRDIEVAKTLGMKSCGVTWGFNSKEHLKDCAPDYLIDSVEGMLSII